MSTLVTPPARRKISTVEKVPVAIAIGDIGAWVPVPLTKIIEVLDVTVLDQNAQSEVTVEWRLTNSGQTVELRSNIVATYTVHVDGY